jgi:hypothetical protein
MKKKSDSRSQNADRPITLIVTVYPPKKDKRRILISAAPDGEMPLMFSGLFPDRHALLDRAFAGVLKRDPQVVTVKIEKKGKVSADQIINDGSQASEETGESDQLVTDQESESAVPVSPITETTEETSGQLIALSEREDPEQLPLIEGDENSSEVDDGEQD